MGVSVPVLGWEMVGGPIEPHVGSCGLVADAVFFGCFVPSDFVVVNTASDVQPFFLCVVHGKPPVWFGRFCVW